MRFWAFLMDLLVVFSLKGFFVYPLIRMTGLTQWIIPATLSTALFFLYFAVMTKKYGQTIGKMIFGLKVIGIDGCGLSWSQIIFREGIGRFIHQVFFILQLLYVTVAFTGKKQGLHDMIADTYVVYERE
ncbi:RDD family protein [bacterium LRH843]|nr:RDD family protein [bacterium LRH843]